MLGVGLLIWGVLAQLGASPSGVGDTIADRTRELLGSDDVSISRNVTVSGSFSPTNLDLGVAPTDLLSLEYEPGDVDITVNGVRVDSDNEVRVAIESYDGSFLLNGNKISLDGTARVVRVNGVRLHTGTTFVKVKTSGLPLVSMEASGTGVRNFKATMGGKLTVQDKVTLTLENEPLEMDSFLGTISLDESLKIEGKARRVFASGQDVRTVVS